MQTEEQLVGRVGECVESHEVEQVLPVATSTEKRWRFRWERRPADDFLMNWNRFMAPNSMFVEALDETGLTVTVRWALMKESAEPIADRLNRWLEQCETRTWKASGQSGQRMQ